MNHEPTEFAEKKKHKNDIATVKSSCLYIVVSPFVCGFVIWIIPLLNLGVHYMQWKVTKPEEFTVETYPFGLIDAALTPVESADIVNSSPNYQARINSMFHQAFWCKFNPVRSLICSITYNTSFGFPERVSWYFLEGGGYTAQNFTIIDD